jgi:hypothetical protein
MILVAAATHWAVRSHITGRQLGEEAMKPEAVLRKSSILILVAAVAALVAFLLSGGPLSILRAVLAGSSPWAWKLG